MTTDQAILDALNEALDDEYRARATYRKVIDMFGPVRPFINIVEAEQRHIDALLRQYQRLGLTPPRDKWSGRVTAPASLREACAAGEKAEIENGVMYTRLLATITDSEVRNVMLNLQEASQQRHLPAFRRCLERSH